MDNFAFKEPEIISKPSKRVRIKRVVSVYSNPDEEEEEIPLAGHYRTPTMRGSRRKRNPRTRFERQVSGEYEYLAVGQSPPAEIIPNLNVSFKEATIKFNVQVNETSIRIALLEQARLLDVRGSLLDDIEFFALTPEAAFAIFEPALKPEKNTCFLWAAFHKRCDLLEPMLRAGVDLNCYDSAGMSAIHLSAFSGCTTSTDYLISVGADVNSVPKCFSPLHCAAFGNQPDTAMLLLNNDAIINLPTKSTNVKETVLHCAVRANAVDCLQLFIKEGIDVNSIKPSGRNPIHLAAELGMTQCLEILLESEGVNINARTRIRDKESTPLHLAAEEGHVASVEVLLSKGADTNLKNHRGFTALHLAARSSNLECVQSLLKFGDADPNAEEFDKRTPLHVAIGKSDRCIDIIETLIKWGANVNQKDEYGYTPMHLAALDGLSHCVETLIYYGADVTTKSKKGNSALDVITRKTPASLAMLTRILDCAIISHNPPEGASNREVELEFDFRNILKHGHTREISYLNALVKEGKKDILMHPLCAAFIHIKWEKIRKYYIAKLVFCFIFILFLSLYVLTALAQHCYNSSKNDDDGIEETELCQKQSILGDLLRKNPFVIETQWWVLVSMNIFEIFRKIYGIAGYGTIRQYLTQPENIFEWYVIVSVFLISYVYTDHTYTWQNHVGAFAVLASWTNLMLMVGQLPIFGIYVGMYQKVLKEFAKLFMAYSCILLGFAFSFVVIYPDTDTFSNPLMSFLTAMAMMIGEQDGELLTNEPDGKDPPYLLEVSAQITYILFLTFITIILMNLSVGIACDDISGLRKNARLSRLVRQTSLISYMELAMFNTYIPEFLLRKMHWSALVSPQAKQVKLIIQPLNPDEKRLPEDVMAEAYEVSQKKKNHQRIVTAKESNDYHAYMKYGLDDEEDSIYKRYSDILALQMMVDTEGERIDEITNEVNELKDLIDCRQILLEKLLVVYSSKIENMENDFKS